MDKLCILNPVFVQPLLLSLINTLGDIRYLFANIDPLALEVMKVLAVSFGWIGSLVLFILRKKKSNLQFA